MAKQINWQKFTDLVNWFATEANSEDITWHRFQRGIDRFMEGNSETFVDEVIPALVHYNYMRTWPLAKNTEPGALDAENVQVYLNKEQMRSLGFLNANNYFDFDSAADRFTIRGKRYRPQGETEASQIPNDALHQLIILRREVLDT